MTKALDKTYDAIIVGGGASGLMCASRAASRGLKVLVLEKGPKPGLKILVSGGGRCNFTNLYADPQEQFLSENPHFCISAMRRYQPHDFIALVEAHHIAYHEKKLGQLFCDNSSKDIAQMLVNECEQVGVTILLNQEVSAVAATPQGFQVTTLGKSFPERSMTGARENVVSGTKVVLASGGLSMPKIATDLAFQVANNLDVAMVEPRAALVPLTWNSRDKEGFQALSGISVDATVTAGRGSFRENILFTHRGLSGPAILQASSYWREGDAVSINLLPDDKAPDWLLEQRELSSQIQLANVLKTKLPNRLVDHISGSGSGSGTESWFVPQKIGSVLPGDLHKLGERLNHWQFMPGGSEGYRTAEVTLGGIDTDEVSSKTFELKRMPGLYAVGEALDVTGWLGGYNFQWAWASGWCCGEHL